jgi:hypothetical protein
MTELEGRELDAKVAEEIFDKPPSYYDCPHFDKNGRILSFCSCPDLPRCSTDIAAAWLVDKPGWYWNFHEAPNHLQITLYPSKELYHKRPWDLQPVPKEIVNVKVNWDECKTKAGVYALGRCRAALMAVEAE